MSKAHNCVAAGSHLTKLAKKEILLIGQTRFVPEKHIIKIIPSQEENSHAQPRAQYS